MRLTLRTLLAYLDDTLEPHEIKEIGQKVAESDAAQELVARIKQITRRRRLTTPPTNGPGAKFDANTVAEYLDNELSSDLVAELEKTCLESDVHLAEVASCHQILTLVVGEPALVPPTARERMYRLVKGREAIPYRKARAAKDAGDANDRDAEDPLLPGMPSSRGWLIWALPLALVLVLAVLAVAVWQGLSESHPPLHVAVNNNDKAPPPSNPVADSGKTAPVTPVTPVDVATKDKDVEPPSKDKSPDKPVEPPPPKDKGTEKPPQPPPTTPGGRPAAPSKERVAVGHYIAGRPSILVQRQAGRGAWKRVVPNDPISTTDDLVSLPGYSSELDLDGGAHVLLRGNVREFSFAFPIMDFLMESAVKLHKPEAGFDADLTLDRGRIYLSNHRRQGPVKVRLRFADEVWDLTLLDADTEIGVDLIKAYTPNINYRDGERPLEALYLAVLTGKAGVVVEPREYPELTAPVALYWDNKGPGVSEPIRRLPREEWDKWGKTPPPGASQGEKDIIAQMREALDKVSLNMTDKKAVETALQESRSDVNSTTLTRVLAVYCFGAVDGVDQLLDALCNDQDPAHYPDRNAAIFTLRRWVSRDPDNGKLLYDYKKGEAGPLLGQKYHYQDNEAENILEELHDFPPTEARNPRTFEALTNLLKSKLLAIRELAYWHLLHLSVGARVKLPDYNAADDADKRDAAADAWRALIVSKDLPPPLPTAPGP